MLSLPSETNIGTKFLGTPATVLLGAALDALIENVVVVNEKVSEEFAKSGLSSKRRARV